MEKTCTRCLVVKDTGAFYTKGRRGGIGRYFSKCKECCRAEYQEKKAVDPEAAKAKLRARYEKNRERLLAEAKERYKNEDPIRKRERSKAKHKKEWDTKRDVLLEKKRLRRKTHPEATRAAAKRNYAKRMTKVQERLANNLRTRLYCYLKKNKRIGSAVRALGCSITELKEHLESQFEPGMSWGNYGKDDCDWSVDHILPLSSFNLQDPEAFAKANHYTNLRPMWHLLNIAKGNKILDEFRRPSCEVSGTAPHSA